MIKTPYVYYKRFKEIGYTSARAMHSAKVYRDFLLAQAVGKVKIKTDYEMVSYFDVYGEPDTEKEKQEIIDFIDTYGIWCVYTEVKCKCCGSWMLADSVGMCMCKDPLDPFENAYVVDLMDAALKELEK